MSDSKDEWFSKMQDDPNNWITKECCVCRESVKVHLIFDKAVANGEEPVYCEDHRPAVQS